MATPWQLITGVTGLLGQHLLIDALLQRKPVVVFARSKPGVSAYRRIDRIVASHEERLGVLLQRPLILDADLNVGGLGLSSDDANWCRNNIDSVIHSAAIVNFRKTKTGEPTKTNVEGTGRLLGFFEQSALRAFHHVSTAYSCGVVDGEFPVAETLHPLSTTFRNVYEESKCQAEHLVMTAPGEFQRSIYRPSIIVGHASTGYSPSFNALYKPMQFVWMLLKEFPQGIRYSKECLARIGFGAEESQNLVPVDWVSSAIMSLAHRQADENRIFHLTNPNPVLNSVIVAAILEVIGANIHDLEQVSVSTDKLQKSFEILNDQLEVYRAYFTVDPTFDCSNRNRMASCPACPTIGREELVRMFSYATKVDFKDEHFSAPKVASVQPYDLLQPLASRVDDDRPPLATSSISRESQERNRGPVSPKIQLVISGSGGGNWMLQIIDDMLVCGRIDQGDNQELVVYTSSKIFADWLQGTISLDQAISIGAILLVGTDLNLNEVRRIFTSLRNQILHGTNGLEAANMRTANESPEEVIAGSTPDDV